MSKCVPETTVLKPRDPSLDDNTDEWPEFILSNVNVHVRGDSNATTSLLEASAGHPVTVTGQLEPLDDEDAHLYIQFPAKKRINLALDVYTFSYGQYGDGSTAIWAAGKAGWYTLKPSRSYRPFYDTMVEAVNVLYFLADSYREPRKKGKGRNAEVLPDYTAAEVFEKYAVEELGSSDPEDGQAKIYQHKDFLIMSLLSGKEGLRWSKYPLYKHLVYQQFPDVTARIRKRLAKPVVLVEQAERSSKAEAKYLRQDSVDTTASGSSARRKLVRTRRDHIDVTPTESETEASAATQESQNKTEDRNQRPLRRKGASAKTRSTRQASCELQQPGEEIVEEQVFTPTKDEDTDEETRMRARKSKSSLRPRASKASKSAVRTGGKGPLSGAGDDDDEPPSSPTGGKRKYPEPGESQRLPKRRSSKTHMDEGIDVPTSTSDDVEDDAVSFGVTSELPLRNLAHLPDPLQEDTWICALNGCSHKVYAASNSESQRLIKEHYALHAYDDDERVQMVKKLQAPSLPAGHLMEKVKQQAKLDGFPGSRQMASRYPMTMPGTPVAQKY